MRKALRSLVGLSLGLLSGFSTLADDFPSRQLTPAPGGNYKVESVSVVSPAGNVTLYGSLLLPSGSGPFPAVVLLPDMGAEDSTYDDVLLSSLADSLARQGIITLRLDERGTGKSGGQLGQTLVTDRLADVKVALNKLRAQPQVDIARIGIVGHGLGGNVALLAGAQPLPPSFIVAIAASGISGRELLANQVPMYGKAFHANYDKLERQRQQTLGSLQMRQITFQMQSQGSSLSQIQAYTDSQTSKLQEADRKWTEALQKHQQSMLEIVLNIPSDEQAQAVLANMMHQHYPDASPEEVQRTVQRMTSRTYRNYLTFNPTAALAHIECPVLLVQGTADTEVNAASNVDVLLKGLNGNPQLGERRLKDLDHRLRYAATTDDRSQPAAPIAYREISHWIQLVR